MAARGEASRELFVVAQNACAVFQVLAAGLFVRSHRARDESTWVALARGASIVELRRTRLMGGFIGGSLVGALPVVLVALPCRVWPGEPALAWTRVMVAGAFFAFAVTSLGCASTALCSLFVDRDALAWSLTLLFAPEAIRLMPGLASIPPVGFLHLANGVRWGIVDGSFGGREIVWTAEIALACFLAFVLADRVARLREQKALRALS